MERGRSKGGGRIEQRSEECSKRGLRWSYVPGTFLYSVIVRASAGRPAVVSRTWVVMGETSLPPSAGRWRSKRLTKDGTKPPGIVGDDIVYWRAEMHRTYLQTVGPWELRRE